jgi:hydrogenase expression/formation protein HypD
MKFIDEYRQSDLAATLAQKIAGLTHQQLKLMEVCGGHTHTIFKYGIEDLLPENIEMIHDLNCSSAGRYLHHVWRRDARAWLENEPA